MLKEIRIYGPNGGLLNVVTGASEKAIEREADLLLAQWNRAASDMQSPFYGWRFTMVAAYMQGASMEEKASC